VQASLTRRQFGAFAGTVAALVATSLSGCAASTNKRTVVCQHQRTAEVYASLDLELGTEITLSWMHSIELTRWSDTFEVGDDGFLLIRTVFSSYGAGMPMDEGTLRHKGDNIIIEDIDRSFEAIRWVHSHAVDYRIAIDGDETLLDATTLPDQELLELRVS
jgi:hypothetical protein